LLAWVLLAAGSVAGLSASVAEPAITGRVMAAWPSFALIVSYELLMRQIRAAAVASTAAVTSVRAPAVAAARPPKANDAPRVQYAAGTWQAGITCSGNRGSGHWPTAERTPPCPAARRSATDSAVTSAGAGWSRRTASLAGSKLARSVPR